MAGKRVLSIGNCAYDHGNIARILAHHFSAEVVPAATWEEAQRLLAQGHFDLVLVNRIFDADGSSGLEVIRLLKSQPGTQNLPVMLISNYEEAQQQAQALGAVRGFGKASLEHGSTLELLRPYLRSEPASAASS
jgi:two-component system chemotaxis response regulator CheY